jgi:hypothetical protein
MAAHNITQNAAAMVSAAARPRGCATFGLRKGATFTTAFDSTWHVLQATAMQSADAALDDDSDRPLDAVCARHPERRASIVCPHCGSFACGDCTVDTLWGDVMCEECQQHGRVQYPLPWEYGVSPVAFVHTAYLVFAETTSVFGALPAGRIRRAFGFAFVVALLTALATVVTQWLFVPRHWAASTPSLLDTLTFGALLAITASLLSLLLGAVAFHLAALAFGGRAPWSLALRGACYLSAVDLLRTAGAIADTIFGGGTFSILLGLVALFFVGWALSLLGEQRYGLGRARAVAAACAPIALFLALTAGLLAAGALLA